MCRPYQPRVSEPPMPLTSRKTIACVRVPAHLNPTPHTRLGCPGHSAAIQQTTTLDQYCVIYYRVIYTETTMTMTWHGLCACVASSAPTPRQFDISAVPGTVPAPRTQPDAAVDDNNNYNSYYCYTHYYANVCSECMHAITIAMPIILLYTLH